MPWFYVDDGFSDSKPVMDIPKRHRLASCGLWVLAGAWSAKEETDGFVPDSKLQQLGARESLIESLLGSEPTSAPLWVETSGGIQFKNWEKWQRTRAELQQQREAAAERQRESRGRKRKGRNAITSEDGEVSRCDSAVTGELPANDGHAPVTRDPHAGARRPDPTRPDPTLIPLVTKEGGVTSVDANDPRPQCSDHETNSDTPCPACRRRRRWDEANAERLAADELDAKRRAREAREKCPICEGTYWIPGTDPSQPCPNCKEPRHA